MSKDVDYSSFVNAVALRRRPSPIRALIKIMSEDPSVMSLGGGSPNPALFPFRTLGFTMPDGTAITVSEADSREALQYSPTAGLTDLVRRLKKLMLEEHVPPVAAASQMAVMVGTGSQDLISKAMESLLDSDTPLVIESPTYSGTLSIVEPIGCPLVSVPTDADGMVVEELERMLRSWEAEHPPSQKRPRHVYTIPTACNPTGYNMSVERRRHLMRLASEFDLLILEDDPYYFLQFPDDVDDILPEAGGDPTVSSSSSTTPPPVTRSPSLFSMDEEGRVLRFDSFSKVLSAGLRIGYATGPAKLIHYLDLHAQSGCLHTSGVSQALVLALFRHWKVGQDASPRHLGGLDEHLRSVVAFYRSQRDAMMCAIEKHLGDLVEVVAPRGGMFCWIRIKAGIHDSNRLVKVRAASNKVLMVPGSAFFPGNGTHLTPFVRASFSLVTPEQMDEALSRFARAIREESAVVAAEAASTRDSHPTDADAAPSSVIEA